jgi:hypothetical protein
MAAKSVRVIAMVAGTLVGGAALLFLLVSGDEAPRGERLGEDEARSVEAPAHGNKKGASSEGVKPRPVDPANYVAAEQTTDPSRHAEFMLEADRSKDLLADVRSGETQWQPTLIDMDFSENALEAYLNCSSTYLRQPCRYDVDYVVEVKEPGVGEVVFGRVVMEKIYAEDCEQYVKCMVKGNVGSSVVVSPDVGGVFSHRKSQTDNYPDVTLAQLREMLKVMEEGVAMMEEKGPDGEPDWEYRLELERSYIFLLKVRIAAMSDG